MMRRLTWRVVPAAVIACCLALTGCGGDDTSGEADEPATAPSSPTSAPATTETPTPSPTETAETTTSPPPGLPDCSEVWVEGRRIPKPYRGCLEGDGRVSKDLHPCSMGFSLAQYGKRFYGVPGRPAARATPDRNHDQTYLGLLATCTG